MNKNDSDILEAMAGTNNGVLVDVAQEAVKIENKVIQDECGVYHYLDEQGRLQQDTNFRDRLLSHEQKDRHFLDLDSLTRYALMHKTDATAAFFTPLKRLVSVVLDGDKNGEDQHMGLCNKNLIFQFPLSKAYQKWKNNNESPMNHLDFAEFFEDNIEFIVEPDASELLTCIKQLEVQQNVSYSNKKNLANGSVEFAYSCETGTKTDKGTIQLPESIKISVPYLERSFNGKEEKELELDLKIRFRLREGRLTLTYIIEDHQEQTDAILAEKLDWFVNETSSEFQTFIGPRP